MSNNPEIQCRYTSSHYFDHYWPNSRGSYSLADGRPFLVTWGHFDSFLVVAMGFQLIYSNISELSLYRSIGAYQVSS